MYFTGTDSLFTGTGTTDSAERSLCHLGLHMPPIVFHLATSFIPWTTRTPRSCNDAQMYAKVRWDDNGLNSFADTRQVGLGGGIEYALHPHFCRDIRASLRGSQVGCDLVERAVQHALDVWADRHPLIYFTRVKNTKLAELIIGAKSHEVIKAKREFEKNLRVRTREEQAVSEVDELDGMAVDLEELSSGAILGFAQPLPFYLQVTNPKRAGKVTGTGTGGLMPQTERQRMRIVLNTDHCFYLQTDWLCVDDDLEGQQIFHFRIWVCLVLALLLVTVGSFVVICSLWRTAKEQRRAASQSEGLMRMASMRGHQDAEREAKRNTVACLWVLGFGLIIPGGLLLSGVYVTEIRCGDDNSRFGPQRCQSLEAVLAHEAGHILGLGHPDQGPALHLKSVPKKDLVVSYTPINHSKMCEGLHMTEPREEKGECEGRRLLDCQKLAHCHWDDGGLYERRTSTRKGARSSEPVPLRYRCMDVYATTLMASHDADPHEPNSIPTADDLAGLFFLYPSRRRSVKWSTKPISVSEYNVPKLKHVATARGIVIGAEWTKEDYVRAILISIEQKSVQKHERFNQERGGGKELTWLLAKRKEFLERFVMNASSWRSSQEHNKASKEAAEAAAAAKTSAAAEKAAAEAKVAFASASAAEKAAAAVAVAVAENAAAVAKEAADKEAAEAASARTGWHPTGLQHTRELFENASRELSNARTAAEEEMEDASSDRLAAMGRVGDLDGDGVDDDDDDGDGLPNEVEAGLDALEELLECVTGSKVCDGSQDDIELVQLPTQVAEHDEHEVEPDKGQEDKEKNEL
jgi:hypothetical protein